MEQHPVPQHIASFEFKLFGNLTVRQFVTLAIPMSLAAAIFFSSLPSIIRLPISGAVALFALFAALVPINGRPLDKWLVSFIKAVTSPTQRMWVKEPKIPEFLRIITASSQPEDKIPETITIQGRERLRAYLRSLPKGNFTPFDVKEQIAVERLNLPTSGLTSEALAQGGALPPPIIWPTIKMASLPQIFAAPSLSMAQTPATSASPPSQITQEYEGNMEEALPPPKPTRTTATAKISSHAKAYALPGLEKKLQRETNLEHVELSPVAPLVKTQLASETNSAVENVISIRTPDRKIKLIHGIGQTRVRKLHFAPPEGFDLSKLAIRGEKRFEISRELKNRFSFEKDLFKEEPQPAPPVKLPTTPQPNPQPMQKQEIQQPTHQTLPTRIDFINKPKITHSASNVTLKQEAQESHEASISIKGEQTPTVPLQSKSSNAHILPLTNIPNVISGLVMDQEGNPQDGAILIIKDPTGIPVRALKTNKLGQFLSATPLNNGPYTLEIESNTRNFDPMGLMLAGKVLEPFQIKAKN